MELTEINIYPIKSLKGISLDEALVEDRGLQFDRRWMLIDGKNQFLTQREIPKMATLKTAIEDRLIVSNGQSSIEISFKPKIQETAIVKIWSSSCRAEVYEKEINNWFSDVLGKECRLVLMPEETKRAVNPFYAVRKFKDTVSFADGYPFLVIGESSLEDLNSRLEKKVSMDRFRPNFVFRGGEPFAEDSWKKIRIGKTVFHVVKPCARCVMTTIDQTTGVPGGKEPLKTLADFRLVKGGGEPKILFGQNLIADKQGEILRKGDKLEVLETKN